MTQNQLQRNGLNATHLFQNNQEDLNGKSASQQQPSHLPEFDFEPSSSHEEPTASSMQMRPETLQSSLNAFLTPENSSENPFSEDSTHTSPGLDEFYWQQSFNETFAPDTSVDDTPYYSEQSSYQDRDLQGLSSSPHPNSSPYHPPQLLSPQLTTTPSPPGPNQHLQGQVSAIDPTQVTSDPQSRDSTMLRSIDTSMQRRPSNSNSFKPSPTEPPIRAASPAVMVSSYEGGDSPSRPGQDHRRHSTKRSQDGSHRSFQNQASLAENDVQGTFTNNNSYHFMPTANEHEDFATGRAGLAPADRGDDLVPSLKDIEEKRQQDENNAIVQTWLSKSEVGSEAGDDTAMTHRRSRSHDDRNRGQNIPLRSYGIDNEVSAPGPGLLVDEDSEVGWSDDEESITSSNITPESPPVEIEAAHAAEDDYFPSVEDIPPDMQEPLPRQFYRRTPWQDPVQGQGPDSKDQPATSNAAMMKYDRQAAQFETASRAATWGTRRRLSESEISSIVEGSKVRHLSLSKNKARQRGSSFINKARGLIPGRSNSNIKKKSDESSTEEDSNRASHKRGESSSSLKPAEPIPNFGRSRSPSLSPNHAIVGLSNHLTATGRSTSATPDTATSTSPFNLLKRHRSRSEIPKNSAKPGLAELMTKHGGPPMPTLASPMHERPPARGYARDDDDDEDDEDNLESGKGIKMDLTIRTDTIIPTVDGFRVNAKKLNAQIHSFLLERIAQEQYRRYKKLVDHKVKHTRVVAQQKCTSKGHCFELNGEATLLDVRTSAKGSEAVHAQFQIIGNAGSGDDASGLPESQVTPALFPPGIPLPPVKRLPAEFECPLCFKVKKFYKPSDWTKHVHEDVSPFTCTFPKCTEPKSFKRKADWVRHENERHRHLEWWKCNVADCGHVCYRKDNFMQHLVREHKIAEPKVKPRGAGPRAGNGDTSSGDEAWQLLEICHAETTNKPRDEECKFCGNVLGSWKKLTVHLGKHMEQIAMPVLELVKQQEVSPDTIISPIERGYQPSLSTMDPLASVATRAEPSLSPYSTNSLYPASPASQSSTGMHGYPPPGPPQHTQAFSNETMQPIPMDEFTRIHGFQNISYGPYHGSYQSQHFTGVNAGAPATYPPAHQPARRSPMQAQPHIPRSQPMPDQMGNLQVDSSPAGMFYQQQQIRYSSPIEADPYFGQYNVGMMPTTGINYNQMTPETMRMMPGNQMYDSSGQAMYNGQAQAPRTHQGYQYQ